MQGSTNAQRPPTDLSNVVTKTGRQDINGAIVLKNTATVDGWKDSSGDGITVLNTTNNLGYTLRMVLRMTAGNIGYVVLQRLDPSGVWQTETEIARLV